MCVCSGVSNLDLDLQLSPKKMDEVAARSE